MRILAVDYGDVRVGIALSDPSMTLAGGLGTLTVSGMNDAVKQVVGAVLKNGADKIVVGLPRNMDGSEGASAAKVRVFAAKLMDALPDIPVEFWDERRTTILAADYMSITGTFGKKRKEAVDTLSAQIILQSYLDRKNAEKTEENASS